MKQVHMVVRDEFYELIRDYMKAKGETNFTRMLTTLALEGIEYDENKGRKEILRELQEIKRQIAGTNKRIDIMMELNLEPHNKNS